MKTKMNLKFKESDFLKASSTLVGTIIGAGIFGVPFVMAQAGFFVGLGYFVILGAIMLILHLMYAEVVEHTKGQHRLIGYSEIYFGAKVKKLVSASFVVSAYGSLIVYILLANNFFNTLFGSIFHHNFLWGFLFWAVLGYGIIRGLRVATKIEFFMFGFLVLTMAVIIFKGLALVNIQNLLTFNASNVIAPFGVILFSLGGFAAIPMRPAPTDMPTAAATQRPAAVVSPRTLLPLKIITPAPKNPIPTTMLEAIREGSKRERSLVKNSLNPVFEIIVKSVDPTATKM